MNKEQEINITITVNYTTPEGEPKEKVIQANKLQLIALTTPTDPEDSHINIQTFIVGNINPNEMMFMLSKLNDKVIQSVARDITGDGYDN